MSSTSDNYNPDIELLKNFFDTRKIHLSLPFEVPPGIKLEEFNEDKFNKVKQFCVDWQINDSQVSNLFWIVNQILPVRALDSFTEWGSENLDNKPNKEIRDLLKLRNVNLRGISIKIENKRDSVVINDELSLYEIKMLLVNYAESLEITKYNFRSEAYEYISKTIERYFRHAKIEQENATKRHTIIGRLMELAGLPVRKNQPKHINNKKSDTHRVDIHPDDPDFDDTMLAHTIRNWINK